MARGKKQWKTSLTLYICSKQKNIANKNLSKYDNTKKGKVKD